MKLFILYQTDIWESKASRVFFSAFDSRNKAINFAKHNDLYCHNSEVVVIRRYLINLVKSKNKKVRYH